MRLTLCVLLFDLALGSQAAVRLASVVALACEHSPGDTGPSAAQNDVPRAIEPDEVEVVLANIDADRRHLICRFAGQGSCSFCYLHPKSQAASRSTVGPSH